MLFDLQNYDKIIINTAIYYLLYYCLPYRFGLYKFEPSTSCTQET